LFILSTINLSLAVLIISYVIVILYHF
jgi:hypothetical protein